MYETVDYSIRWTSPKMLTDALNQREKDGWSVHTIFQGESSIWCVYKKGAEVPAETSFGPAPMND